MKKIVIILVLFIFSTSCIPLRIAPKIKDYKIKIAKKFKRKLPKNYAFIFEDPKEADEFYYFINLKYKLNHENVESNVRFEINNEKYFLSFYETVKPTKVLGFFTIFLEASIAMALGVENSGNAQAEIIRTDSWYLVLTVSDLKMKDCLEPDYINRVAVLRYLKSLKLEYINSSNHIY